VPASTDTAVVVNSNTPWDSGTGKRKSPDTSTTGIEANAFGKVQLHWRYRYVSPCTVLVWSDGGKSDASRSFQHTWRPLSQQTYVPFALLPISTMRTPARASRAALTSAGLNPATPLLYGTCWAWTLWGLLVSATWAS